MKQLALLMFAILILGCGTETSVVDEPPPVIEEPPPVVIEAKPIGHPLVADGTVKHGEVNVDPESLGHILRFEFTEPFLRYRAVLREKDGYALAWDSLDDTGTNILYIQEMRDDPLRHDTEYVIEIFALNYDCESIGIVIQFRTKPWRRGVERPEPVMQQRPPVVPSGERFRFDIAPAQITDGTVFDGQADADPEPINANGILFHFDRPLRKYSIDLRLHNGATLGWLPRGLVEPENPVGHIKIMPTEGFPLLEFDTTYQIDIFVEDFGCWTSEFTIGFRTKPKP